MEIIETPVFAKEIVALLSDSEYCQVQLALVENPKAGVVIPGSGGLRKLRWAISGKGKRGGIRIIYYWQFSTEIIIMLFAYKKSACSDLTKAQIKTMGEHLRGFYYGR